MRKIKEELLADFLENRLSPEDYKTLETVFDENEGTKQEFEEAKTIYFSINKPPEKDFDSEADSVFYNFLLQEKSKLAPKNKTFKFYEYAYFKYAAAVVGLLLMFFIGRQSVDKQVLTATNQAPKIIETIVEVPIVRVDTQYIVQKQQLVSNKQVEPNVLNEIGNLKKEMQATKDLLILSMLKRESASERIQAVNYSYDLQKPDDEVLKALIYTLDYDRNINVRIAAADAIGRFGYDENVRNALVKSLLKQQEPTLQISIIELLTKLNERRALPAFRLLVEDESISAFVRQKAEEGSKLLSL
ncbi:HEAT repeat domain-containing protein [Emticicia sp. SJ17W-69]|uniref:HEAT repeat domain-containing protein n=1 Tax=Emticicia sp. SJ17W-69 TaxID=3421657 RepID=UPI003EBD0F71